MRNIITISVPPAVKRSVDAIIKQNKYASVSEYFRDAVRALEDERLIKDMDESQRQIAAGKGKILRSLRDLM